MGYGCYRNCGSKIEARHVAKFDKKMSLTCEESVVHHICGSEPKKYIKNCGPNSL
jgi:hypothetical protein